MHAVPCFFLTTPDGAFTFPLAKRRLVLGRTPDCDLWFSLPTVSKHHCKLKYRDGFWVVHDLHSSNGTSINGVPIHHATLMVGDVLGLGRQVQLRLTHQSELGAMPTIATTQSQPIPGISRPIQQTLGTFHDAAGHRLLPPA